MKSRQSQYVAEAGARIIGIGMAVALLVLLTLAYWHGE
jgi:hypothetical protein